jgi:hypothetical protein
MLGYIKGQLERKSAQLTRNNPNITNKYALALNDIRNTTIPGSIPGIISKHNIEFNGDMIIGGKLSKKSRKTKRKLKRRQKGGYTYNKNAQRRTFSSKTSSSPRSSSRSSSKTSSLHKDKARGSKTRKTL